MFRVYWCLLLTVIPIIFLLINAQLNILKSFPVLIVVPLMPILLVLCLKATRYVTNTFGKMSAEEIERYTIKLAESDYSADEEPDYGTDAPIGQLAPKPAE